MTEARLAPVAASERIALFDVLRGFALLGILLVNFMGEPGNVFGTIDALVVSALAAFISWSFYPLFSFLFGLGFAVQLARAEASGTGASMLYFRRMLVLFLIGTAHAVLVWGGDILVRYSIAGLLLIPLHRLPRRVLLTLAGLFFIVLLNKEAIRHRVVEWRLTRDSEAALVHTARAERERIAENQYRLVAGTGATWSQTVEARWGAYARQIRSYRDWLTWLFNDVILCFMLGLIVGRARILHDPVGRRRALLLTAVFALLIAAAGLLSNATLQLPEGFLANLAWAAENYGMTVFYISAIAGGFAISPFARRVLVVFAAPGRMGLTNYLMQSLTMTWLSLSYGLAWRPSTTAWLVLNLGFFFGLQVPFSRWWLARYRYGPAEWLWRSVTYGTLQPMRAATPEASTPAPALIHT